MDTCRFTDLFRDLRGGHITADLTKTDKRRANIALLSTSSVDYEKLVLSITTVLRDYRTLPDHTLTLSLPSFCSKKITCKTVDAALATYTLGSESGEHEGMDTFHPKL